MYAYLLKAESSVDISLVGVPVALLAVPAIGIPPASVPLLLLRDCAVVLPWVANVL